MSTQVSHYAPHEFPLNFGVSSTKSYISNHEIRVIDSLLEETLTDKSLSFLSLFPRWNDSTSQDTLGSYSYPRGMSVLK